MHRMYLIRTLESQCTLLSAKKAAYNYYQNVKVPEFSPSPIELRLCFRFVRNGLSASTVCTW